MKRVGDDNIEARIGLSRQRGARVAMNHVEGAAVDIHELLYRPCHQRVQLGDDDRGFGMLARDRARLGIGAAAGKEVTQPRQRIGGEVLVDQFLHQVHVGRDQHRRRVPVVDAVQQVVEHQGARLAERRAFGGVDDAQAEVVAFAVAGARDTLAGLHQRDADRAEHQQQQPELARRPGQERQRQQQQDRRRQRHHQARAEILDQHEPGDESAEDAAERGECVHATDNVPGAAVEVEGERGQQRGGNAKQHRGHEKQAEHVEETGADQVQLALLQPRRQYRQGPQAKQAGHRGQRQRDPGAGFVCATIGPAPAEPVAERQPGENHADDGSPAVDRHTDVGCDQSPRGDFQHQQDCRAEEYRQAVPGEAKPIAIE